MMINTDGLFILYMNEIVLQISCIYLYYTLIVGSCMWSFIVLGGFRGYKYICNGYRSAKYVIARSLCPLHAIRRYQVLSSLDIINKNNNHENVKYAATNIVNKMTIVDDLNGFGTTSFKILFTLYMSEFRHMPWGMSSIYCIMQLTIGQNNKITQFIYMINMLILFQLMY